MNFQNKYKGEIGYRDELGKDVKIIQLQSLFYWMNKLNNNDISILVGMEYCYSYNISTE